MRSVRDCTVQSVLQNVARNGKKNWSTFTHTENQHSASHVKRLRGKELLHLSLRQYERSVPSHLMMVWFRRIDREGWRKVKSPVLSKSSLKGKAKKLCVSKQMLKIYVSSFISLLANTFTVTMLFPFLPFMVQFLLPELKEDKESIGKYAGIIAAFMFLGKIFGSYVWGVVADRKGRKPVIIASCLFLGLFSAAFGFSVHFVMAVILQFGVGLMSGIVGTVKAVISEASDNSNQAFGITMVACAWGVGLILGPAVSGAIADPIGQYNLTVSNAAVHGFLTKFPYSLPCILNLILGLLAAAVTVCLLPETLGMKRNKRRDEELDEEDSNEQEASSSSEEIAENTSNEETDNTALDTALGDGSHCTDVDLGTLGRRPFAMREDDTTGSKTPRFSATREPISETLGSDSVSPLTSVAHENTSSPELQTSPQTASHLSVDASRSAVDKNTNHSKSSNGRNEYASSGGVCAHTKSGDHSDLGGGLPTDLNTREEVCSIEEIREGDTCETDVGTVRAETRKEENETRTDKSQRSAWKERRRSSFLIPFFNRHDSFTPSFVKPSQSALRQKAARMAVRRKLGASEGAIHEADVTSEESQQEIEMPEGLSSGDSDRERLLEDTVVKEESSRTRRVLKRMGRSIKSSLIDLKLFLCTRTPFLAILNYCMVSSAVIGFEQIYAVWAATPPYLGGLGFVLHDIGLSMTIVGVLLLPFTLVIFPVLEKFFGAIKTYYISCISSMVIMILLPNLHYLVGQRVLLWFLLILMVLLLHIAFGVCFACSTLFINNSVTFDKLGAINGLAISLTSMFRTVAPLFCGGVFSASLSETTRAIGFPLDSHLIFLIFGATFLGTLLIVAFLPQSVNRQKIVD